MEPIIDPAIRSPLQIALNTLCIIATKAETTHPTPQATPGDPRYSEAAALCLRAADHLGINCGSIDPPDNGDQRPA